MTTVQGGGVGLEEMDGGGAGVGAVLRGERAGLVEQLGGEVEGGEMAVAEGPEAERHAAGATAGLEEWRGTIGEVALDEEALGGPEAELVGGARVVEDGREVVKIGADGGGGDLFQNGGGTEALRGKV